MLGQHLFNRLTDSRTQLDLDSDCGRITGNPEIKTETMWGRRLVRQSNGYNQIFRIEDNVINRVTKRRIVSLIASQMSGIASKVRPFPYGISA
jgi:hypothetical protein